MTATDVIAGFALIVASITFYFQFFWRRNAATLTFLGAELRPDNQRFTARLCITNTGDTPLVITEIVPLFFEDSKGLSARAPGQSASEPKMPVSVQGRSHCIVELKSDLTNAFGLLRLRPEPPYVTDSVSLDGGVSLKLISANGEIAFGTIKLFQVGVSTNTTQCTYTDKPIELLAPGVLKRSGG